MRNPLAKSDDHGVTDLLREVAQRNSSLNDEERREVSEMVRRVEQHKDLVEQHKVKPSAMGMMKKKLAEINLGSDIGGGSHHTAKSSVTDEGITESPADPSTEAPVNKLAKDFFQKLSSMQTLNLDENRGKDMFKGFSMKEIQNPLKSTFSKSEGQESTTNVGEDRRPEFIKNFSMKEIQNPLKSAFSKSEGQESRTNAGEDRRPEFIKNFSMKGIQNPLKSPFSDGQEGQSTNNIEGDKRPEFIKAFEQSSQNGKEMLRKFSEKIQNPLLSPAKKAPATAAAISESLRASQEIQSTINVHSPDNDVTEAIGETTEEERKDGEVVNEAEKGEE